MGTCAAAARPHTTGAVGITVNRMGTDGSSKQLNGKREGLVSHREQWRDKLLA